MSVAGLPQARGDAVDYDPFVAGPLARVAPTTEPQREVWLADRMGREASLAYNESVLLRLRGALDRRALCDALQDLVDRHESLRATLGPDGEQLCIAERIGLEIPFEDLSALPLPEREARLQAAQRAAVDTPFDLERGPLLRAALLRLGAGDHALLVTAHHIVCDGWSYWVIVRELANRYARHAGTIVPALPPPDSFADYAIDQASPARRADAAADERWWLSRFPGEVPVLDLPADRPRAPSRSYASGREDVALDAGLLADVRALGARRGASVYATLLAGFAALLQRVSGQTAVVIGIPAAGQSQEGHDALVGHAVHLLPLRIDIDPVSSFHQLLDGAKASLLDAYDHQRCTYGQLLGRLRVARDPGRLPLVNVMFNIDQALDGESAKFPGLELEFSSVPRTHENFELFVNAVQTHGALRLECQYNSDLFDGATIARWMQAYATLLRDAVARPDAPVAGMRLVDAAAQAELAALQPARSPVDLGRTVLDLVAREPQRAALRAGDRRCDYAWLEERANRLAHSLRSRGVQRGALVGVMLERTVDLVATLLGVWKAGGAYVPLDPAFPRERLAYMASDARLALLVTDSALAGGVEWPRERTLLLDADAAAIESAPATRLARDAQAADAESVAYVLYTSGSTGKPKGVQVPHRAVVNFLASMQREPGLSADDRLVAVTTLSFDIAVLELLLPLTVGAEVVLASREQATDGHALAGLLESSGATAMQATPATWRLLLEAGWSGDARFKALVGGEALPADLAMQLRARCGQVWNLYGPTETTVWSTCWKVERPEEGISIGRPIANTTVWVLDERRQLCPVGVPGELWIGGEGVALGYLNRPELTAERFVADPYSDRAGARLYRTGDRGRWLGNGTLEHLGRLDFQVKVRGYRIELGEVEAQLVSHASVARAVAMVREDRAGDARLVAYVVLAPGALLDEAALRAHLKGSLPEYMVPAHILALAAIPLTPNGKVDRKALPAPDAMRGGAAAASHSELAGATQRPLAGVWRELLGLARVGANDNFFDLGGHSLLAMQAIARMERLTGKRLNPRRFIFQTLAQVASSYDEMGGSPGAQPGRIRRLIDAIRERVRRGGRT